MGHIAKATGTDATEVAPDVLTQHQGQVWIVHHAMNETDDQTALSHCPAAVASDGWLLDVDEPGHPHPWHFGTFARGLETYVREQRLLSLSEAVLKMTSLPPERIGLTDRGLIAENAWADLAVFDPAAITAPASYEDPRQDAKGILHVLVNGTRPVEADNRRVKKADGYR